MPETKRTIWVLQLRRRPNGHWRPDVTRTTTDEVAAKEIAEHLNDVSKCCQIIIGRKSGHWKSDFARDGDIAAIRKHFNIPEVKRG